MQSHRDGLVGCFHCSLNLIDGAIVLKPVKLNLAPLNEHVKEKGAFLIKTHSASLSPWASSLQLLLNYPNLSFQIDVFS